MVTDWQQGKGVITHTDETLTRLQQLQSACEQSGIKGDGVPFELLVSAVDTLTNAAKWLTVHQAYALHAPLDGSELHAEQFKKDPQGHLGGSLNMVPAYLGYLLANALTGETRSWVMGQGHCVAAIDSVNLLVGNMNEVHAERYGLTQEGVDRFVSDFYNYRLTKDGKQESPLASHVNPHTAGGMVEGGYLGFTDIQYAHMPLKGEKLVAFLSDGAFEEQRGADWTPHWWRPEDSGLITPIMIYNERRIDQRTTLCQSGGPEWFAGYLRHLGFDPIIFDGTDPLAYAWAIIEQERRLEGYAHAACQSSNPHMIEIPYGIAVCPKGAGFYNAGTLAAHALPLPKNPREDTESRNLFNEYAKKLWVTIGEIKDAVSLLTKHQASNRIVERMHPLANRNVSLAKIPQAHITHEISHDVMSPMEAVDHAFAAIIKANPELRVRFGNPDEMRSNKMIETLELLQFRTPSPEANMPESFTGSVISVLNEEAVAGAAFGNKGGINMIVSYEAFATKMLSEIRQEIIFAKHQKAIGTPAKWLSIPIIATTTSWENGKNELSHQDPSLVENLLGETSDIMRVVFPADYHSSYYSINALYKTQGEIWGLVIPKRDVPQIFTAEESVLLIEQGGCRIAAYGYKQEEARINLCAIGSYQLWEILSVSKRLTANEIPHIVTYIYEPGRFREARNPYEAKHLADPMIKKSINPASIDMVFLVTHMRPEVIVGLFYHWLRLTHIHPYGFIGEGGTLDVEGMMFVNQCSYLHILRDIAAYLHLDKHDLLTQEEYEVIQGQRSRSDL